MAGLDALEQRAPSEQRCAPSATSGRPARRLTGLRRAGLGPPPQRVEGGALAFLTWRSCCTGRRRRERLILKAQALGEIGHRAAVDQDGLAVGGQLDSRAAAAEERAAAQPFKPPDLLADRGLAGRDLSENRVAKQDNHLHRRMRRLA